MHCPKCGAEISETAQICQNCGEAVNVIPQEAASGSLANKPKGPGKKWPIAAIVILVAIAASLAVWAASRRDVTQLMAGKDYGKSVMENIISQAGGYIIDSASSWSNPNSVLVDVGFSFDMPEEYVNDFSLMASYFMPEISYDLISLLANSGIHMNYALDFDKELIGIDAEYSVDETGIITAEALIEDSNLYLNSPELFTDALLFGGDTGGAVSELSYPIKGTAEYFKGVDMEPLRPALNSISKAIPEHFEFSVQNGVDVSVNGKDVKLDAVIFEVSRKQHAEAAIDALNILLSDDAAIEVLAELMTRENYASSYYGLESTDVVSASEIKEELEGMIADFQDWLNDGSAEKITECRIYLGSANELAGFAFKIDESSGGAEAYFVWVPGTGYEIKTTNNGENMQVYGALSTGDKKSGDMSIKYESGGTEGDSLEYSGKILSFSDLDEKGGTFTVNAEDLMAAYGMDKETLAVDYGLGAYVNYLEGLNLNVTCNSSEEGASLTAVLQNSDGVSIEFSTGMLKNKGEVLTDWTADAVEVSPEGTEMLQVLNVSGIEELVTKLADMGYDLSDMIDPDVIGGMLY